MMSLSRFFNNRERVERVLNILKGDNALSLRLVDWFITNYARKHNIIGAKRGAAGPLCINIYLSYRSQLKTYSKQQFDPFRRHERIVFEFEDLSFETTVGQLNFFRWAIENEVLEYIERHKAAIEASMVDSHASQLCGDADVEGAAKIAGSKRCAAVSARRQECRTVISFD
jgi:hypothetical protein